MAAPRRRASRTASASAALAASSLAWASLYARAASLTASSPSLFTSHLLTIRYVPYHTGLVWGLGESQAESWADTPHAQKGGERGQCRTPLPITHVSPGRSQPPRRGSPHAWGRRCRFSYNVPDVGPSPHAWGAIARSGPDHPHVRGADVHEPNGAAPQRTTRRRSYPQFWGYGAQHRPRRRRARRSHAPGLFHA